MRRRTRQAGSGILLATAALALTGCQHGRSGINDRFRHNPDIDEWAGRWESSDREIFQHRDRIVAALGLQPGMDVADVGAGTGAFIPPLSHAVGPGGSVVAVDIIPGFLEHIRARARQEGLDNVHTVLGEDRTTHLPAASVDAVLLCATYHHFEHPESMLASITEALRPGGRLAIVDFERIPGVSREWVIDHVRAGREQVVREVAAAGFRVDETVDVPELEENYFLLFHKQEPRP